MKLEWEVYANSRVIPHNSSFPVTLSVISTDGHTDQGEELLCSLVVKRVIRMLLNSKKSGTCQIVLTP